MIRCEDKDNEGEAKGCNRTACQHRDSTDLTDLIVPSI